MADSNYDMKRKLMELQSELLRNSIDNQNYTPSAPAQASPPQAPSDKNLDEIRSMLKELHSNQQLMLKILMELKSKIK